MTWLDKILPLIGVLIGALLTPLLSSRIENKKVKSSLKPELVRFLYMFYNLLKEHYTLSTYENLNGRKQHLANMDANNLNLSVEQRTEIKRQYDTFQQDDLRSQEYIRVNFKRLIKVEASILSNISQIQVYYDKELYDKLMKLIQPEISKSNNPQSIFDFSNSTEAQMREAKIRDGLLAKSLELDQDYAKVIGKLDKLF